MLRSLFTIALATLLSACVNKAEKTVNLFVWSNYTSPEQLAAFTKATGIKVNVSNYASNEEMLAKLQAGAAGFDIVVPSDYMVTVMTNLGLLTTLDKSNLPNAQAIDAQFLGKAYDPTNRYSLPYAWSLTGIGVDRSVYQGAVSSWGDLFANAKVKGRISLLDDVRETVGAALKFSGASLNSTKGEDLSKAKQILATAKANVKAFNSSPIELIGSGDVAIAHMYSNDCQQAAHTSGKNIEFVLPKEGGTMSIDNAVILENAPHAEAAYVLLNFLYQVGADAALVQRTFSGPVLTGVRAALPDDLRASPVLFPSAASLANFEMMQDLGEKTVVYDRIWTEVKAASH